MSQNKFLPVLKLKKCYPGIGSRWLLHLGFYNGSAFKVLETTSFEKQWNVEFELF